MKKLRVVVLVHYSLVPPDDLKPDDPRFAKFRTEYEVKQALSRLGHEVRMVGYMTTWVPSARPSTSGSRISRAICSRTSPATARSITTS